MTSHNPGPSLVIMLCIVQCGCNVNPNFKDIGLVKAAEEINKGATSLSKAIEAADVTGMKTILADNKDLREKLGKLTRKLEEYTSANGVVEVSQNSRVYFQIVGYRGALKLDAWVDSETPDNMFIRNADLVRQMGSYPAVSYDIATKMVHAQARVSLESRTGQKFDDWNFLVGNPSSSQDFARAMGVVRINIDSKYRETLIAAFDAFLKDAFVLPLPESNLVVPQAVDLRFLEGGRHRIYVRITPQENDSSGHWNFAARTFVEHPSDGKQEQIDLINMSDRDYPGSLKKKLNPAQAAGFVVRIPVADSSVGSRQSK